MTYPTISEDAGIQEEYIRLRECGESHNFAEILAFRVPPGTRGTERAMFHNVHNQGLEHMTEAQRNWKLRRARQAGVDTTGKVFMPELARPGVQNDPLCWVSDSNDVARVLKMTGRGCPEMGIKPAQYLPKAQPKRLSERLVQERMESELSKMEPKQAKSVNKKELREQIIEKHGAKKIEKL